MNVKKISFNGFDNCYALTGNSYKLIVVAEIGPRILHFSKNDSDNVLFVDKEKLIGKDDWKIYGGHRVWLSPESDDSYSPDNLMCEVHYDEDIFIVKSPVDDKTNIQKSIEIKFEKDYVNVKNIIENKSDFLYQGGIWALTCINQDFKINVPWGSDKNWSNKKIIYWDYWAGHNTDIGNRKINLKQESIEIINDKEELKIGTLSKDSFILASKDDLSFIKKSIFQEASLYPDDNCNIEVYGCKDFFELETLSPSYTLFPNKKYIHLEKWFILSEKIDISQAKKKFT